MMSCITTSDITPNRSKGHIQVVFGPMFSGKTTELMRRMRRYSLAKYECLTIKYAKDTRYDLNGIATHDQQVMEASVAATLLMPIFEKARNYEVIAVDEGQFFPDIVEFCERLADIGKVVIVAALDGTYQREGFGDILRLVPLAESIIKLTSVCMMCFGEASFTKRKGAEKEVEVIGGEDKYLAVCRACYKASPCKQSPAKASHIDLSEKKKVRRNFGTVIETNTMEI